jgi:glutamine amidotransferase PdxT
MIATPAVLVVLLTLPASQPVEVALFTGDGVRGRGPAMLQQTFADLPDLRLKAITADEIRAGKLADFRVLIHPGGAAARQAAELAPEGREAVRRFVADGGCFVGICAGCYLVTTDYRWSLGLIPAKVLDKPNWERGRATLRLELTAAGRNWFGRADSEFACLYNNGPVLKPDPNESVIPLAYFREEIVRRGAEAGLMINTPAMVAARYGQGWAIGISPHPEQTDGLKDLIPAAIRWVLSNPAD